MKWMLDLTIRTKLLLGAGLLIVFLVGQSGFAYVVILQLQKSQKSLFEVEFANVIDLLDLRRHQNGIRAAQLETLAAKTPTERQEARQDLDQRIGKVNEINEKLLARYRHDPDRWKQVEEIVSNFRAFKEIREMQVVPLINAGKTEQARQLIVGVQTEHFKKTVEIAESLESDATQQAARAVSQSEQLTNQAIRVFLTISLTAFLAGIALVALLNRMIAAPVKAISHAAAKIATGELAVTPPSASRADEIGLLLQTFSRMTAYLKETANVADRIAVGDLRVSIQPLSDKDMLGNACNRMTLYLKETAGAAERIAAGDLRVGVKPLSEQDLFGQAFARMIDNLKSATAELAEGASVLAAATSEILASTTQVASGVAETATAISQTTATVEEVKQAGQLSSQKAKHVADSAQKANDVAQGGIQAVTAAIDGMNRVQDQVASVAQSIVTLSEQSQAIGEIIATVNDLAEQSNLLAVNASIEAAKAGEQGKGFTVVAQEIRSLAEQSKQATVQVRQILNDIQKATGAAVMATEQGTKIVETGMRQSREAGESIRLLGETVNEAAQAAVQIAASSQQQLAGMGQVALAMENIKTASSQNVGSTRQTETAAQNLHELGQKIKALAERYQV